MDKHRPKKSHTTDSNISNISIERIIACMPGSVYWKDTHGVYQGCNDEAARMLGLSSREACLGLTDKDFGKHLGWDINIVKSFERADKKVIKTGEPLLNIEEFPFQIADGSIVHQISNKVPLFEQGGKVIGVLGMSIDIAKQKKHEEELLEAKGRAERKAKSAFANLENVIACMPGSVYWKDKEGIYQGANDFAVRMMGLSSREEIIGKTDYDFANHLGWSSEVAEFFRTVDNEVIATGKARLNFEEPPFVTADKNIIYQLSNKVPLFDEDSKPAGVVGISIDITERKKAEEELRIAKEKAEAANLAKSEFLAVASHELRLPLTAIMGFNQLLGMQPLTAKQKEYVDNSQKAGQHLLSLIGDILDFARLEAEKFELAPAPMDFKTLVEETATMLSVQAKNKEIDLRVTYEPDVPHRIIADSRALRQIIINLVGNALKFTDQGHVAITVRALTKNNVAAKLEISVEDTGIGIPENMQSKVFEYFQQVDSSYSRPHGGTGLGLTITKKLVNLMDGKLSLTSELGKGSIFRCEIEFSLQEHPILELPWMAYQSNVRVLVVDDSARGDVVRKQICRSNCQVVESQQAMDELVAGQQLGQPYQVVIIDSDIQAMNALAMAELIQARHGLVQPMLLLLTEKETLKKKNAALEAGFFETITKPTQPIDLQSTLTATWEQWLGSYRRTQNKPTLSVLLVEDEPLVLMVHREMIETSGCKVETAVNGKAALACLSNNRYDIVFLDMGLPDIGGPEVLEAFRKQEGANHTPVIALTGYGRAQDKKRFLDAGADSIILKPTDIKQIQKTIAAYCPHYIIPKVISEAVAS